MIGRAASSNPWIFRQIGQYVATGCYEEPSDLDRYHMIRDYYRMLLAKPDHISGEVTGKMKQFATYFTRGVRNGAELRKSIYRCHQPAEVLAAVDAFFEKQVEHAA
jgi:tRNA-dihydrouridine synthase